MRLIPVLLSTLALALAGPAWSANPVRVATDSGFEGAILGNVLVFPAFSAANGVELWRSDGTLAGTGLLKDLLPGTEDSFPGDFVVLGGVAYFTAYASGSTIALWKTDGTAAGTAKVVDLPGTPTRLQAAGSALFFNLVTFSDFAVWRSDGTPGGTQQLKAGFSYLADEFTAAVGRVFFSVDDGQHGEELWATDGTPAGTQIVKDIFPGEDNGLALGLRAVNGRLLFGAYNGQNGVGLWRTDGTEAGTVPVGPTISGISEEIGPVLGNAILLTAFDSTGPPPDRSG